VHVVPTFSWSEAVVGRGLVQVGEPSIAVGDPDDDGDLDLAVMGRQPAGNVWYTQVYRNEAVRSNTPPGAPSGLQATRLGSDVTFSWSRAFDAETPSLGLTCNLRVWQTVAGKEVEIQPAMADPLTGKRRIPAMGNVQQNTSWTLRGLASGTYHWTVQAIDTSFVGGPWGGRPGVCRALTGVSPYAVALWRRAAVENATLASAARTGAGSGWIVRQTCGAGCSRPLVSLVTRSDRLPIGEGAGR